MQNEILMPIAIVAEKDDLFAQSELMEGKYKFSRGDVLEEEWPEFSFWDPDASTEKSEL